MKAFACPHCHALVFFENSVCVTCGTRLGFDRSSAQLVELFGRGTDLSRTDGGRVLRPCVNSVRAECNWLQDGSDPQSLCPCCALTRTRPEDSDGVGMVAYARTEAAKRRLVFELDFLGLPTTSRKQDPEHGLAFDLLSSIGGPVTTGHDDGVITIDLAEGDDPHREAMRVKLAEPYRTLLGHLRHEVGHWYWGVLIDNSAHLERFRALFGDERADYAQALKTHYGKAPSDDWALGFVSHYAASHPWEDWAETFAHYLHIRDTLQTAASWQVAVGGPDLQLSVARDAKVESTPSEEPDTFSQMISTWLPLTFALNAMSRSMGNDDMYPFVLPPAVLDKMRFIHTVIAG